MTAVNDFKIPCAPDAEKSVLGGLMMDNQTYDEVCESVCADDFFNGHHKRIYECIEGLAKQNQPFDTLTLGDALGNRDQLAEIGGLEYLAHLSDSCPSAINTGAYAKIVHEKSLQRGLLAMGNDMIEAVKTPGDKTAADISEEFEQQLYQLGEGTEENMGRTITEGLMSTLDNIQYRFDNPDASKGLSSGFKDLDEDIKGFEPADLVIIAGRPSMGKTSFAMNLVKAPVLDGKKVVVFSLEMPEQQINERLLSSVGKLELSHIRETKLMDDLDWSKLTTAFGMLKDKDLIIDDTAGLSPTQMRARTRRYARQMGGIDMIMVDYIQLMHVPGIKNNRTEEISQISRSLKALAKEFNCPVLALSQLNRQLEQRPNKRPVMSDLRESGAIEQDADLIMFIYRDEVYDENSPEKGIAEIIRAKHRNGEIGTTRLAWLGKYTSFGDLAPGSFQQ